jgi:UDP-N-acetylglucosamine diphosphorylase/glucosamine-1-phosphate N-acetyltransferase
MDKLLLEEDSCKDDLRPFSSTRSVLDIRMGILTFREKWERLLGTDGFELIAPGAGSLSGAAGADGTTGVAGGSVALPANLLPTPQLANFLKQVMTTGPLTAEVKSRMPAVARVIRYPWDIFHHNAEALAADYTILTAGRKSRPIPESVQIIGTDPGAIFIEEGARLEYCLLNVTNGPIYIGRNAEIMEGSLIRGPFACCEGAVVKMGAKIYGATTLGPYSTAGGEIKNSVIFGYSNKGHDGYLGDAVIGEWCNLGAGTSASNLKNNAGDIRVYHPGSGKQLSVGLKCGLLMGDYSRAAINTAFHTGTVVGVCCNIFGEGKTPKYIPDFSWGQEGRERYEWEKALRDITNWKKLKNQSMSAAEVLTLKTIFEPS